MGVEDADFGGYATKANLKCSDGRTIMPNAFQHQDGTKVPLVYQHGHSDNKNVLGHAILENRADGVYAYAFFNNTEYGKTAKEQVNHGDLTQLSIYANKLIEKSKVVTHGIIREVSLVLAGANPGALIDFVRVAHSADPEDISVLEDEAIIYTGLPLELKHSEETEKTEESEKEENMQHADKEKTVQDVFDSMNDEQKQVVYYLLGEAAKGKTAAHADADIQNEVREMFHSLNEEQQEVVAFLVGETLAKAEQDAAAHAENESQEETSADADTQEGNSMTHNVFEGAAAKDAGPVLSHADQAKIFERAKSLGTLKAAVMEYAANSDQLKHGIDDIEILFPDAKAVTNTPEFVKRRTEWVATVLGGTRHTPFSRIKSLTANLTFDEARAKGYIKGSLKREEFFRVAKRVTTPQTIYKKQQLDRDDILDITDFDVVVWLKGEMRLMLEEEIARAILIGDGRSGGDVDKINEENIRPIATDNDLYITRAFVDTRNAGSTAEEIIDTVVRNRRHYRGSGNPIFFCSEGTLSDMLLVKDGVQRRIYNTTSDISAALRASNVVPVELLDNPATDVIGILVNLQDYVVGADKGGEVNLFDDFDIDYNQYKYLIETRISGALVKAKSALVIYRTALNSTLVDPVAPSWNNSTKQVTVATTTGITYKNKDTGATLTTGSPVTLAAGQELTVIAVPNTNYHLANTANDEFFFTYESGRVDSFGF